jgi:DNA polymerase-3 subunit delta
LSRQLCTISKIPGWIEGYVTAKNYRINAPGNGYAMPSTLGNDLSKIANELDKLMLNIAEGQDISLKEIHDNIGISKEYNVFELQAALARNATW